MRQPDADRSGGRVADISESGRVWSRYVAVHGFVKESRADIGGDAPV